MCGCGLPRRHGGGRDGDGLRPHPLLGNGNMVGAGRLCVSGAAIWRGWVHPPFVRCLLVLYKDACVCVQSWVHWSRALACILGGVCLFSRRGIGRLGPGRVGVPHDGVARLQFLLPTPHTVAHDRCPLLWRAFLPSMAICFHPSEANRPSKPWALRLLGVVWDSRVRFPLAAPFPDSPVCDRALLIDCWYLPARVRAQH